MGGGSWTAQAYSNHYGVRGMSVTDGVIKTAISNQEMFVARDLDNALNPRHVIRECCDSEEHPNTIPIILALDVTGSMGQTAVEIAKKLNVIITDLYSKIQDVEFMIMGIGDFSYDSCPLQVSQFESDIRIAEQLDKLFFEFGGGGNSYESYSAAWYFATYHTKLDCWNRGKKGIIITMGDEQLNPYIPLVGRRTNFVSVTGDRLQDNIETKDLYEDTIKKYDIYHINVLHRHTYPDKYEEQSIRGSFAPYLDDEHFKSVKMSDISSTITDIIINAASSGAETIVNSSNTDVMTNENGEIIW